MNGAFAAISNVCGGVAARSLPIALVIWVGAPGAVVIATAAAVLEGESFTWMSFLLGVVGGLVVCAALMAVYRAFAIGPVGLTAAVLSCSGAVLISLAGFAAGEPVTLARVAGLALCVVAVGLLTYRPDPAQRTARSLRGPLLAALGAAGFTVYVLILDNAPTGTSMWALSGARSGILLGATLIVSQRVLVKRPALVGRGGKVPPPPGRRALFLAVAAGTLDGLGNVALVLALQVGELFLFALLAPFAPLFTALIGRAFLHEHITRLQVYGVALACFAVVIASL
ncbi:EamA family transporter [Microbacterium sp. SLBN-154]|uniref:EamA family transporter n=1 Tax=Microbacterium sp. SLBN-154 TaxID=2768458 RepID=UPI001358B152|nr:EamA family transporter [Microbacterium sp. SLBN-154]